MRRELGIFSSSFIGGRFVVCVFLPFTVFVVLPHVHATCVLPCHFSETEFPAVRIYSIKKKPLLSLSRATLLVFSLLSPPVDLRSDVHPSPASPPPSTRPPPPLLYTRPNPTQPSFAARGCCQQPINQASASPRKRSEQQRFIGLSGMEMGPHSLRVYCT